MWQDIKKPKHTQQPFSLILIYLSVVLKLTLTFRIVGRGAIERKGLHFKLTSLIGGHNKLKWVAFFK